MPHGMSLEKRDDFGRVWKRWWMGAGSLGGRVCEKWAVRNCGTKCSWESATKRDVWFKSAIFFKFFLLLSRVQFALIGAKSVDRSKKVRLVDRSKKCSLGANFAHIVCSYWGRFATVTHGFGVRLAKLCSHPPATWGKDISQ